MMRVARVSLRDILPEEMLISLEHQPFQERLLIYLILKYVPERRLLMNAELYEGTIKEFYDDAADFELHAEIDDENETYLFEIVPRGALVHHSKGVH